LTQYAPAMLFEPLSMLPMLEKSCTHIIVLRHVQ
jgi:hypothetical protein